MEKRHPEPQTPGQAGEPQPTYVWGAPVPSPRDGSRKIVAIMVVVIVIAVILSALGILYIMEDYPHEVPPLGPGISFERATNGTYWELTFTSMPIVITTTGTYMEIVDPNSSTILPRTPLASLDLDSHGAAFIDDGDDFIEAGEQVLLKTSWYVVGCVIRMFEGEDLLSCTDVR